MQNIRQYKRLGTFVMIKRQAGHFTDRSVWVDRGVGRVSCSYRDSWTIRVRVWMRGCTWRSGSSIVGRLHALSVIENGLPSSSRGFYVISLVEYLKGKRLILALCKLLRICTCGVQGSIRICSY